MRVVVVAALLLLAVLAGCADETPPVTISTEGLEVEVTQSLGAVRGVVVDTAIKPVAKVDLVLTGQGTNKSATSDDQGRFTFDLLPPGTYFLKASHLLYNEAQVSVDVLAGVEPPVTKVQLVPKFTQKPYVTQAKFQGFIQCGYQGPIITAPCVTDYTTIACAGGCVPQAHDTLQNLQGDNRFLNTTIDTNWQTAVFEMTWDANGQGTTKDMGILVSFTGRTAGDWFGNVEGANPLLLRFEVGEKHPSEQGDTRPLINATGNDDLAILGSIKADDTAPVGVGISQTFEIFQTNFYNAKPPADWSFVRGDPMPF